LDLRARHDAALKAWWAGEPGGAGLSRLEEELQEALDEAVPDLLEAAKEAVERQTK
jgi:hypothetical protein